MAKSTQQPFLSLEDLTPYIKLVGKNWWMLVAFVVLGYGMGRLVTHRQVDVHKATAELLLTNEQDAGVMGMMGRSTSMASAYRLYNDDVQNQLRVLRSYDLIGRVIDKIDDPVDYALVGRIKESPVEGFAPVAIECDVENWSASMTGKPIDLFVADASHYRLGLPGQTKDEVEASPKRRFGERVQADGMDLTIRLKRDFRGKQSWLEEVRRSQYRFTVFTRDQRIQQYRGRLKANNIERTSVLSLSCQDVLPSRAKRFLDTLAATFIDYTAEARLATNLQTEAFIGEQLAEINALTDTLERQVDFYRAQNQVLDLSREQAEYFTTLIELERRQRELDMESGSLEALEAYLQNPTDQLPPVSFLALEDPVMTQQLAELYELQARRSAMLLDVQPGSYQVRRLDSTAKHVRGGVVDYLADRVGDVGRRKVEIAGDIRDMESRLSDLPKTQRDILAMERKLGVNEKLAIYLLERKAATIIARASITPEARLIERARHTGLVGPDKGRTLLTYTLGALALALALAVLRSVFFDRIDSMSELREIVDFPVIGGIPFFREMAQDPIAVRADSRSSVTEAFRALRTNLQYLLAKEGANVILVSSLHPQEGKSFVSANLASILAKAGKRVALVDFDMHKPKVHTYMGMENVRGASSLLIGKTSVAEVIQKGLYDSLDVIPAGPIPPNASDLILSDRMKALVANLKAQYDYVILDTPPILLISDALVLMEHVDTALLITNVSHSSRRGVQHLEGLLAQNGLKHASFVLNGVKTKRWLYYYNRYAAKYGYVTYGAEYGYGYGYGGSEKYRNPEG